MKESVYYAYGEFVPKSLAKLSINDLGFVRAYSAYECLRTYGSQIFRLKDHLDRLMFSCSELRISLPSVNVEEVLQTLVEKNFAETDLMIRIYVTAGLEMEEKSELFVLVDPAPVFPEEYYNKGISVVTSPAGRVMTELKSTQYANAMVLLKEAQGKNAQDVLYIDEKECLLELTKANFFAVINGCLVTPHVDILPGITRKVVLELARELEIPTETRPISVDEIKEFGEAFLTSTMKEIMPIRQINDFVFEKKAITHQIREAFQGYTLKKDALICSS